MVRRWLREFATLRFGLRTLIASVSLLAVILGIQVWRVELHNRHTFREKAVATSLGSTGAEITTADKGFVCPPEKLANVFGAVLRQPVIEVYYNSLEGTEVAADGLELRRQLSIHSQLRNLLELDQLERLTLRGIRLSDEDVALISRVTTVRWLDIDFTGITPSGIRKLRRLDKLETLHLAGSNPGPDGLHQIAQLDTLRALWLDDVPVGDAGLKELQVLPLLEAISISDGSISESGILQLTKYRMLRSVFVNLPLTDRELGILSGIQRLRGMTIRSRKVTDTGIRKLVNLKKLQQLELRETRMTDDGLLQLARLPSLQRLEVYGELLTERGRKRFDKIRPGVLFRPMPRSAP